MVWPALLVDANCSGNRDFMRQHGGGGRLRRGDQGGGNRTCRRSGRRKMAGRTDQFLLPFGNESPTATANLLFRVASGATVKFTAAICVFGNQGQQQMVCSAIASGD